MANFKTHRNVGVMVGLIMGLVDFIESCDFEKNIEFNKLIKCLSIGALGGLIGPIIPDILEPAHHPNHRSLAHGFLTGGLICHYLIKNFNTKIKVGKEIERLFLVSTEVAYISHLILDAGTKKSLPIVM